MNTLIALILINVHPGDLRPRAMLAPKVTCAKAIPIDTRKPPFTERLICQPSP